MWPRGPRGWRESLTHVAVRGAWSWGLRPAPRDPPQRAHGPRPTAGHCGLREAPSGLAGFLPTRPGAPACPTVRGSERFDLGNKTAGKVGPPFRWVCLGRAVRAARGATGVRRLPQREGRLWRGGGGAVPWRRDRSLWSCLGWGRGGEGVERSWGEQGVTQPGPPSSKGGAGGEGEPAPGCVRLSVGPQRTAAPKGQRRTESRPAAPLPAAVQAAQGDSAPACPPGSRPHRNQLQWTGPPEGCQGSRGMCPRIPHPGVLLYPEEGSRATCRYPGGFLVVRGPSSSSDLCSVGPTGPTTLAPQAVSGAVNGHLGSPHRRQQV